MLLILGLAHINLPLCYLEALECLKNWDFYCFLLFFRFPNHKTKFTWTLVPWCWISMKKITTKELKHCDSKFNEHITIFFGSFCHFWRFLFAYCQKTSWSSLFLIHTVYTVYTFDMRSNKVLLSDNYNSDKSLFYWVTLDRLQNHVSMRSAHLEAAYLEALQYLKKTECFIVIFLLFIFSDCPITKQSLLERWFLDVEY